jgi:hypothetical protein
MVYVTGAVMVLANIPVVTPVVDKRYVDGAHVHVLPAQSAVVALIIFAHKVSAENAHAVTVSIESLATPFTNNLGYVTALSNPRRPL